MRKADTLTKKELGQYFTPKPVVDFAVEMARAIGGSRLGKGARVIDPACGAGAFLEAALKKGIGSPATIFGLDIDPKIKDVWERNGLGRALNGNLYVHNGLYDPGDRRISEKLPLRQFDLVIGNPPYGGVGVRGVEKDPRLLQALKTFELWAGPKAGKAEAEGQENLFAAAVMKKIRRLTPAEVVRLERFPVEVLFVERFVRLAKPGGVIAIVVPDGILANSQFTYVRAWLQERCHVVAIVSLPRGTFRGTGTSAKTSLLFLRKKGEGVRGNKRVFMAQLREGDKNGPPKEKDLNRVVEEYGNEFDGVGHNSPVFWKSTTTDDLWNNRWDAEYWDPAFTGPIKELKKRFKKMMTLGDTKPYMTYGAIITGRKPIEKEKGILYINPPNFVRTGLDVKLGNFIGEKSDWNEEKSRLEKYDVLIVRAGVGCAGRAEVYNLDLPANVGCYVDILRQDKINPYYLTLFLKSKYGDLQFKRLKCGVGPLNVSFSEIKSIRIPVLDSEVIRKVASGYSRVLNMHYKAIFIKTDKIRSFLKTGKQLKEAEGLAKEDTEYKKLIAQAEKGLDNLLIGFESYLDGRTKEF